jgi:pyridoxal phosphate enzyme (YggS family)
MNLGRQISEIYRIMKHSFLFSSPSKIRAYISLEALDLYFKNSCMSISENIQKIKSEIPESVTLVAVSKTKPTSDIILAYDGGQRIFGENKIQEMASKYEELPKDIQWHMIGNVQTNKIKYMAPFVNLVHGVDREKVLKELNKQAVKNERKIDCLLQVHIAKEDTKFGFSQDELIDLSEHLDDYANVNVIGLMGMATNTGDKNQIKLEFEGLRSLFQNLKEKLGGDFNTLSMGMSGDYNLAIEKGSNMIRVGSSIFGARNYV